MKKHTSISVKILLLASINILLLGLVLAIFVRVEYRLDLNSLLLSPGRDRILAMSRLIALQLPDTQREEWNKLLAQYGSATDSSCYLFNSDGIQLAGPSGKVPSAVLAAIRRDRGLPFDSDSSQNSRTGKLERTIPPPPVFVIKTDSPRQFWVTVRIPIYAHGEARPIPGMLVWGFSSFLTNPVLFDSTLWLAVIAAVILVSVGCWLPLIRGLTRSISQLTDATAAIAEGKLETRLSLRRRDELGRLSGAINYMAERLSGYVNGQKRFLGDIAHELSSPIARVQLALGILEQRAGDDQREYIQDVQEEVDHMSGLVGELLLFSKAGIGAPATPLTPVNVSDTVESVLQREATSEVTIETHINKQIEVLAHPDCLFRALANVVRNAVQYAGDAGPIVISANRTGDEVSITVADNGPGLPSEELEQVFKPFYRPEMARQRETGGVGLGLAIVRSCIEACRGTVTCHNRQPKGLIAEIKLPAALR